MGSGNNGVGSEPRTRGQQMAGAMPQQGTHVMGDNECAPQKLVRLVGCRDSRIEPERPGYDFRAKQLGQTKR